MHVGPRLLRVRRESTSSRACAACGIVFGVLASLPLWALLVGLLWLL
jgi:hypothetical protein